MEKDPKAELKRLKEAYLETERVHEEEKDCLLRVIHTFGTVVGMHEEMADVVRVLEGLVRADQALPRDLIETELGHLKDKILAIESEALRSPAVSDEAVDLRNRLLASCRMIRKIMDALTEDFYPLPDDLAGEARGIDIHCGEEPDPGEMERAVKAFTVFIEKLRIRISEDFRYINNAFLVLLDQVKELERALAEEFGGEENLKEIEYFEMKVNTEMVSIVDSFHIHRTIDDIRSVVAEKIENIKRLVTLRKEDEVRRAHRAGKNIEKLKQRIVRAERGMLEMSRKAARFRTASEKDGLTGLYNRKAFDRRIREALKAFHERGVPFSLMIFDVDRFKGINDTFGHVAGDRVLQKVAQCLVRAFREDDFIARYGGDEFVVVIEALTGEMARERILKFHENLRRIRFTSRDRGDISVTVSAGTALSKTGDTPEDLIERADGVLYESKQREARDPQGREPALTNNGSRITKDDLPPRPLR